MFRVLVQPNPTKRKSMKKKSKEEVVDLEKEELDASLHLGMNL